jgi:arylsulfatase
MVDQLSRRGFLAASSAALAAQARKPNVILMYADDLGYGDLGCYGSKIRTPNLDRLASEGMRFTQCLSANPVCSPSRAALLTGRYPTRVQMPSVLFPRDTVGLPKDETTIAGMLQPAGYRTMCVGKWHLGHHPEHLPTAHGFDEYFGIPYSNDMEPPVILHSAAGKVETVEARADMNTLAGHYTREAVSFIDRAKNDPFFLYFPNTFPHIPLGASAKFRGKSAQGLYGDVVEELDHGVGEVLSALKRNNLERETMVIFSSDNGPWFLGSPGPLRGRKGTTYEGGVRVPLIAKLPGRVASGKVSATLASTMDILPTIASVTGAKLPGKALDGIDLTQVLSGKQLSIEREALLYFDNWHAQCIRHGQYKLHVSRYNSQVYSPPPASGRVNLPLPAPELYNVATDIDESYDIAAEKPEVVKDLTARYERLLSGFPKEVSEAWAKTKTFKTTGQTGTFPRVVPQ